MHLLLGVRRLALSFLEAALVAPAIVIGTKAERLDALPVITAGPGTPTDKRGAASIHLRTDVSGSGFLAVHDGTAWGAPIQVVEDAAAAAQETADGAVDDAAAALSAAQAAQADATQGIADAAAAQDTADGVRTDLDALSALIGDVGSVVGPEAPPGYPADLTAGFVSILTNLEGKLSARSGTVTILAGQTTGTATVSGTNASNRPVFLSPASNPGLAVQRWGSITNGVITATASAAPAGDVVFYYLVCL